MSEEMLSQEEINALIQANTDTETGSGISKIEEDIVGEVGNIFMSQAATTLSSLLNHKVLITTPRVSCIKFQQIIDECTVPKVVTTIGFKKGLTGDNLLMMEMKSSAIIANLMMGNGPEPENNEITDLELSAVNEAMNQMIGSASTAMATMLEREIDIFPPNVEVWNNKQSIGYEEIKRDEIICVVAFDLDVEGILQSEIMQIFTLESVREIAGIMMPGHGKETHDESQKQAAAETLQKDSERIRTGYEKEEKMKDMSSEYGKQSSEKIPVQKPEFQELTNGNTLNTPRNLDLILDVPLEFSVVLGESRKSIKDILSLGVGSVIELNKMTDEPLEIYVNGKLIAEGEVVVINESFGIRITNILSREQRIRNLR